MLRNLVVLWLVAALSSCGTTYVLPDLDEASNAKAASLFEKAKSDTNRRLSSKAAAESRFRRVASRVRPVAEALCKQEMAERDGFDCDVSLEIDTKMQERNAYFTYINDEPTIRLSLPILQDAKSDHEVAFIMSHEYGHLIGRHIEKQQQQAVVGALILGAIAAYSNAYSAQYGGYYDPNAVSDGVALGAAAGSMAFSQEYELESDTLGTRIATAAGYDAVEGAKFFARSEHARTEAGKLSFWGTHPPNEKRLATVIAVDNQIKQRRALEKRN